MTLLKLQHPEMQNLALRMKAVETLRACTPVKLQQQVCVQVEQLMFKEESWSMRLALVDLVSSFLLPVALVERS